jgi:hypothetical protein
MAIAGPNQAAAVAQTTNGDSYWFSTVTGDIDTPDISQAIVDNSANAGVIMNVPGASAGSGGLVSEFIQWSDFGFAIPPSATILGVLAEPKISASSTSGAWPKDLTAQFMIGATLGTNLATNMTLAGLPPAYVGYGGATELGGLSLTPAIVNDPSFGFQFNVDGNAPGGNTALADACRITVYFSYATVDGAATVTQPTSAEASATLSTPASATVTQPTSAEASASAISSASATVTQTTSATASAGATSAASATVTQVTSCHAFAGAIVPASATVTQPTSAHASPQAILRVSASGTITQPTSAHAVATTHHAPIFVAANRSWTLLPLDKNWTLQSAAKSKAWTLE